MPGFDRTGPAGSGPLTGRKRGRCRDNENRAESISEKNQEILGVGRGGRARGSGKGNCFGGRNRKNRGRNSANRNSE